eukprot:GHVL01028613.1.p1 GENE.GHVL01028613.1~~GHVL01028613.1.p1  ORF type:complete len:309 (+),score=66.02 GHVL01028613.1:61-987(+)
MDNKSIVVAAAATVGATAACLYLFRKQGLINRNWNWFNEISENWPGQAFSVEYSKILFSKKSKFQNIKIIQTKSWGRMLILDNIIQCSEKDEFSYQEMMAHLPLYCHENPKFVLVIGGGDGGVLREVSKHPCVSNIHIADIDEEVIKASKEFLPEMSVGFKDPRLTVHITDGCKFVENKKQEFDVIIVDSPDPGGAANTLFSENFYRSVFEALKPGGVASFQGECMWLHLDLIKFMLDTSRKWYNHVEYATMSIPTYPCGQIGVLVCSKGGPVKTPIRDVSDDFQYYSKKIHQSAFVLPAFVEKILNN